MIYAPRISREITTVLGRQCSRLLLSDAPRPQPACLAVGFKCGFPEHLRQIAGGEATERVHLPQPVLRGHVSLKEHSIIYSCGLDVRYAIVITDYRGLARNRR